MALGATVKGITIEFNGDTTKLSKAMTDINGKAKGVDKSLSQVNRALKFNPTSVELLSQKQTLLGQKVTQTKDKLEALKRAQAKLDDDPAVDNTSQDYMELQREIIETESKLKHFENEQKKLGNVKMTALGEQFQQVGQKMTTTGQTMTRYVTTPLLGVGAAAVKVGADFDAQMSKVKALSGATGKDMAMLEKKAREMGAATSFSATEAGQGLEYMALAGWDAGQMAEGIKPILDLAAAADMDLGEASDIVTDALSAFGLEAKDAAHFADVLAKTSTKSNTTVSMLGESFKYVAPVAGAMGYKVEDVNVALGLMANRGIKASSAGTSLRTLLTNMAKPTDAMAGAMEELGVSLETSDGKMKSFDQVMRELRAGFGNLKTSPEEMRKSLNGLNNDLASGTITQQQYEKSVNKLAQSTFGAEGALKAEAAATLAGKTGMAGLLSIVSASDEEFNKLTTELNNADGATGKMASTMLDNSKGAFTIMKSALSEVALVMNESLAPIAKAVAETITSLANKFAALSPETQKIILAIAGIAAAAGPLLIFIGKMATGFGAILKVGPQLISGFKAIGGAFSGLIKILMANPWMIIAALAIAAIVLIVKNWDTIKKFFADLWAKVKEVTTKVWNGIKSFFVGIWNGIKGAATSIWGGLKSFFVGLWNGIKGAATSVWNGIKSALMSVWNGLKTAAKTVWNAIKTAVMTPINAVKSLLSSVWNGIKSTATRVWNGIKSAITSPIETAKNIIKGIIDKIKGFFNFDFKLPKIKLPHFTVKPKGWKFSDLLKGKIPSLGIDWYAKGGIFDGPSVVGVGEAGPEAVVPLDRFWRKMDEMQLGGGNNITINVTVNGAENPEEYANRLARQLKMKMRTI